MRPLSPEEIKHVRQSVLRPLRWVPVFMTLMWAIFVTVALRDALWRGWIATLVLAVSPGVYSAFSSGKNGRSKMTWPGGSLKR